MKPETAPTISEFKKAWAKRTGKVPSVRNGVTAIAQRGRFFRVKMQHDGRPTSAQYNLTVEGSVRDVGDWGHLLFTGNLPKPKAHEGKVVVRSATFAQAMTVHPYEYVTLDLDTLTGYRLAVFGAYNAMGLIGSEHNGLVLFDNKEKEVVADRMCETGSGWGGPSHTQVMMFTMLGQLMLDDAAGFAVVINKHFGVKTARTEVRS